MGLSELLSCLISHFSFLIALSNGLKAFQNDWLESFQLLLRSIIDEKKQKLAIQLAPQPVSDEDVMSNLSGVVPGNLFSDFALIGVRL